MVIHGTAIIPTPQSTPQVVPYTRLSEDEEETYADDTAAWNSSWAIPIEGDQ